jgi:hypothetical protein
MEVPFPYFSIVQVPPMKKMKTQGSNYVFNPNFFHFLYHINYFLITIQIIKKKNHYKIKHFHFFHTNYFYFISHQSFFFTIQKQSPPTKSLLNTSTICFSFCDYFWKCASLEVVMSDANLHMLQLLYQTMAIPCNMQ